MQFSYFLPIAVSFLFLIAANVDCVTETWGFPTKYCSTIYTTEIIRAPASSASYAEAPWVDISFPELGDTNDYTIVAMHAFDMLPVEAGGQAVPLEGGVGTKHVKVRFLPCSRCGLHFKFTICGLDL